MFQFHHILHLYYKIYRDLDQIQQQNQIIHKKLCTMRVEISGSHIANKLINYFQRRYGYIYTSESYEIPTIYGGLQLQEKPEPTTRMH